MQDSVTNGPRENLLFPSLRSPSLSLCLSSIFRFIGLISPYTDGTQRETIFKGHFIDLFIYFVLVCLAVLLHNLVLHWLYFKEIGIDISIPNQYLFENWYQVTSSDTN